MTEWIITSSVLILTVFVLRTLLKGRISPRFQYGLWALVLARLLMPGSLPASEISVMNAAPAQAIVQLELQADQLTAPEAVSPPPEIQSPALSQPGPAVSEPAGGEVILQTVREPLSAAQVLTAVWIAGMVCVSLAFLTCNLGYFYRLRRTRVRMDVHGFPLAVYRSAQAAGPCLFGLIRPGIYLPPEDAKKTDAHPVVLTHEFTHYRHGDHIWFLLRCVCLVIHWFNPLVWLAAVVSKQDAELACDAAAISLLGEDRRREYGNVLIDIAASRRDPRDILMISTAMSGDKRALRERISMIAKHPRMKAYTRVLVVLVMSLAVLCTFTGSKLPESLVQPDSTVQAGALDWTAFTGSSRTLSNLLGDICQRDGFLRVAVMDENGGISLVYNISEDGRQTVDFPYQAEYRDHPRNIGNGMKGVRRLIVNNWYEILYTDKCVCVLTPGGGLTLYRADSEEPAYTIEADFCFYRNIGDTGGVLLGHYGDSILAIDLFAEDPAAVCQGQYVTGADEDWVYYTDEVTGYLYRSNPDGSEPELLLELQVDEIGQYTTYCFLKEDDTGTSIWTLFSEDPENPVRHAWLTDAGHTLIERGIFFEIANHSAELED